MSLKAQIQNDLKDFLRAGKKFEAGVLRMILSSIHNREIEKRSKLSKSEPLEKLEELSKLTEEEIIETLSSEAKKRKEAIFDYERGKRQDLADKEKKEIEILQKYLPEQLSEEEIKKFAKEAIAALQASLAPGEREKIGPREIGKVMGGLMPKIKGRADGTLVSEIVKSLLAKPS